MIYYFLARYFTTLRFVHINERELFPTGGTLRRK